MIAKFVIDKMNCHMCSLCMKMRFQDNHVYSSQHFKTVPSMLSGGGLGIHLHDIRV